MMPIDHSVYPDVADPPESLDSSCDKADYVHRICGAWDFGVPPDNDTVHLFSGWKHIFDDFPIHASPSYAAFRMWYGWEQMPCPEGLLFPTPFYAIVDTLEERPPDPCEHMI